MLMLANEATCGVVILNISV